MMRFSSINTMLWPRQQCSAAAMMVAEVSVLDLFISYLDSAILPYHASFFSVPHGVNSLYRLQLTFFETSELNPLPVQMESQDNTFLRPGEKNNQMASQAQKPSAAADNTFLTDILRPQPCAWNSWLSKPSQPTKCAATSSPF